MLKEDIMALQASIQDRLDAAVAVGDEIGCQFAVYIDGELAVNVCAGWLDAERTRLVDEQSLFPVFSTGKGIATTAFLCLVERGLMTLDQKVGEIWPEFACNGKEETTVRHILQHRTGVSIRTPYDFIEQIADWDVMSRRVAAVKPVFPPGSTTRYQTINYTWLLGELAQRVTGKPFQQVIEDEVLKPMGLQNLFFGVPDQALDRVAPAIRGAEQPAIPENPPCWDYSLEEIMNNRVIQQACLPGFNCITNAIDLAKHYAALLDSWKRMHVLKPETLRAARTMSLAPNDPKPTSPAAWSTHGLGYLVADPDEQNIARQFGHSGYGGSNGAAWTPGQLSFGFTMNLMRGGATHRQEIIDMVKHQCRKN